MSLDDTFIKAGDYWYQHNRNVQRIVRIDDSLLTISNGDVQSHDLGTISFEGNVVFPNEQGDDFYDVIY